ncbi:Mitochondrial import receptor subunit TOM7-like [Mizuhopecten yessoensis]|uniref:Mitochondrial import receptor subunit TOM7 homolog n=1 Tax=Mizuhopecten yessoensis TaxID=6573 RepID=A0A210PW53_MIZYE|nr:Mitochondrial import receptor subunit TOM7-like [Mizuhopecten yessoensis]
MSPEMKKRVSTVLDLARVTFQYGFLPTVIYLGFKKGADEGMPELSWQKYSFMDVMKSKKRNGKSIHHHNVIRIAMGCQINDGG